MHTINGEELVLDRGELKWHVRYLELAQHVSNWSKDPSTKVGSVLLAANGNEYIGYNGFPPGVMDTTERLNNREDRLLFTVHAEQNAIRKAGHDSIGSTLYVWPSICGVPATCVGCTRQAASHKVKTIVSYQETVTDRWRDGWLAAVKICNETKINYIGIDREIVKWHHIY